MPTFIFTSPDGIKHSVTGPEGATQEQAFQMLQSQLSKAPAAPQAASPPAAAASPMDTAKGYAGAVARGAVGAVTGLADLATTVPYNLTQAALHAAKPEKPARYAPSISGAAEEAMNAVGVPKAETTGQKAAQYGTEFLTGGGAGLVKNVAKGALVNVGKEAVKDASGKIASPATGLSKITESMNTQKNKLYEKAKSSGVVHHPEDSAQLIEDIASIKDLKSLQGIKNNPNTMSALDSLKEEAKTTGGVSLANLIEVEKALGASGEAAGMSAKKKVQAFLDNPEVIKNSSGDVKGIAAYQEGKKMSSLAKQHESLVSALSGDSSGAIRKNVRKILDSDAIKFYSPEVRALMEKAASGTSTQKVLEAAGAIKRVFGLKTTGAGIIAGGAATAMGTPIGVPAIAAAAGLYGATSAAKSGAKQIAKSKVSDALKAVELGK